MRVITGKAGGQVLKVPKFGARPTTDRVREALFSILGSKVENARVLDLFAGSGALGIEALSRGAASCVFLEKDRQAVRVIGDNLRKTKLAEAAQVITGDALSYAGSGRDFDLILADPPYADFRANLAQDLLDQGAWSQLLADGGLFVLECEDRSEIKLPESLSELSSRTYGRSRLLILEKS